jgi:hypothetical protein
MSSAEDALTYWHQHEGLIGEARVLREKVWELLDGVPEEVMPVVTDLVGVVFKAGWTLAGGDQRLRGVSQLQELVDTCCGDKAGKHHCAAHPCKELNDVRKALGDTDLDAG